MYMTLFKENVTIIVTRGVKMTKKEEAVKLIEEKMNKKTFLTYKEIADITGYHPKYILKLKKEDNFLTQIFYILGSKWLPVR